MKLRFIGACFVAGVLSFPVANTFAALKPEKIHLADARKTKFYLKDGLVVGGDRAINDVVVKDIRRALNPGFERIVIDLSGNKNGESVAIPRPPYFQVAVTPDEKRLTFTVWGKPKLAFDAKKILQAFKKSPVVSSVELYPRVEDESWTFVMAIKGGKPVEVFELSNPVRVIVDVRLDRK